MVGSEGDDYIPLFSDGGLWVKEQEDDDDHHIVIDMGAGGENGENGDTSIWKKRGE